MLPKLPRNPRMLSKVAWLGMAALLPAGCAVPGLPGAGARDAKISEFASAREPGENVDTSAVQHVHTSTPQQPAETSGQQPDGQQVDTASGVAAPVLGASGSASMQPGQSVIVDSLVGQVNGAPVYAEQVFGPIDDQLRAVRGRTSDREFEMQAAMIIADSLRGIVMDNLFLAQARAQLTPEERTGLFSLMRYIREHEVARGGGTRTGAEQRLQAREGMGLDETVAAHRDEMLIRRLFSQKIDSRVIVSWRDVEREYQRRQAEFNPPTTLKVSRISVSRDDAAAQERVEERLAAGESFLAIAESLGQGGVWQEFQLGPEGVGGLDMAPALKEHLEGLGLAETSRPFQLGSSTWWLHVIDIERPAPRSLYEVEVQQSLMRELQNRRHIEERDRYLMTLLDDSIKRELDTMLDRLIRIAIHRYGG